MVGVSEEMVMSETKFLRLPAVIERVGKSRTAIYRDIQAGAFPAPIRIGARAVAWDSAEIAAWQQRIIAASTSGAGPSKGGA
jgi:prophage regulatory protein